MTKIFYGYDVVDVTYVKSDEGVHYPQPIVVNVGGKRFSIWELGLPRDFRVDLPSGGMNYVNRNNMGTFLRSAELSIEISKDGFDYEVEYNPHLDEYYFDTGSCKYAYYKDNLWRRNGGVDARTLKEWIKVGEEEALNDAWGYPVVRTEARSFNNYKIDAIVVDVSGIEVRVEEYGDCYSVETASNDLVIRNMFSGFFSKSYIEHLLKRLELSVEIRRHGFEEAVKFDIKSGYYWFKDSRTSKKYLYSYEDLWCGEDIYDVKTLKQWAEDYDRMVKLVTRFKAPVPKDSGTWFKEGGLKITTVQVWNKRGVVIVNDEKVMLVVDEDIKRFDSLGELSDWLESEEYQ